MTITHRRRPVAAATSGHKGLRVVNKADGPAELYIYDAIDPWWGVTAKDVVAALKDIDADELTVYLNSPGGDVFEGIAITNALRRHKARVTAVVDGLAASAASFIACSADEVVMARNSELMIHDASGFCYGPAEDMRTMANDLDRISANIASIYAERCGTAEQWRAAMLAETWYSADEAVEAGLADRVDTGTDGQGAKASYDLRVFAYAGRAHAPQPLIPTRPTAAATHTPPAPAGEGPRQDALAAGHTTQEGSTAVDLTEEQITILRTAVGLTDDADGATLVAAVQEALAEQAEPTAPQDTTPAIPEGMALMDSQVLADLQSAAASWRQEQQARAAQARRDTVRAAIRDGRIPSGREEHWVAQLEADPGAAEVLAKLQPGLVPLQEIGVAAAETDARADDDTEFAAYFPNGVK